MDLDLTQFVVLGSVIVGITELLNRVRAKDYWVVASIVTAALVGAFFGAIHYYANLDWAEGLAYGFGASGALSAIGMIGKKSTAAPSSVLRK